MKHYFRILFIAMLMSPLYVAADVMHYSLCTLNDGQTLADAQAWVEDWRQLVEREGTNYKIRLLVPHASPEEPGQFFIEGSSATLTTYAAAWEWWYGDQDAAASASQIESVAECDSGAVYITTD